MARNQTAALTADGRSEAIRIYNARGRGGGAVLQTVVVQGSSFGGGTATLQITADEGTTWIDVTDDTGTAVTFTANGARNTTIASDAENPLELSINLAGATSPNISLIVYQVR